MLNVNHPRSTLFALLVLVSCGPAQEDDVGERRTPKRGERAGAENSASVAGALPLARVLGDTLSFARITTLTSGEGVLVVSDRMMSPHLSLVSLETGEVLHRALRNGSGPGEVRDITAVQPTGRGSVMIYDPGNGKEIEIKIDGSSVPNVIAERRIHIDRTVEQVAWLADGSAIAAGPLADNTFLRLSKNRDGVAEVKGSVPFSAEEVPHHTGRRLLNRSFFTMRPDEQAIAVVHQFKARVDYYTPRGELVRSVDGPRPTVPAFHFADNRFVWDKGNEMAYLQPVSTQEYVFAPFCGCRMDEEGPQLPTVVHVFDWNGNLVTELPIGREVLAIGVDPKAEKLWGALLEPYPMIGEWSLREAGLTGY